MVVQLVPEMAVAAAVVVEAMVLGLVDMPIGIGHHNR